MNRKQFRFALNATVALNQSDETGTVIGRAEYTNSCNSYLVRYQAGDNRQTESWWAEDALEAITD